MNRAFRFSFVAFLPALLLTCKMAPDGRVFLKYDIADSSHYDIIILSDTNPSVPADGYDEYFETTVGTYELVYRQIKYNYLDEIQSDDTHTYSYTIEKELGGIWTAGEDIYYEIILWSHTEPSIYGWSYPR